MMKSLMQALTVLFAAAALTACQGQNTETVREIIREPVPSNGYQQAEGGVDSGGGGNGVNGRPLESYSVRLQDVPEFNEYLLPIIRTVQAEYPRFASDLVHIAMNRTWYLIPVELNKLPAQVIGVSFGDKQLQQLALQNLNAVWINSDLFAQYPSNEDRAILILHEMIMGVRLMKHKNRLDQCYSEIALLRLDIKQDEYRKQRDLCARKFALDSSDGLTDSVAKISLSKDDYDNIRELVITLWRDKGEISKPQLEAWMKTKSFRNY
ncbi:hypothetical protein EZJ49_03835 [Bdellovibrio bacteriovorus]|uniref:hypothetical protein n=1 Tax=Bdellovibrio bacteriovorus TaxID=959 RepID=UPI0021D353E7|nr:hypothetical protein [Bdellovibrio bacteriovorus]UXR65382.1 hypothetical protein EZJ49_03835 [Bdellovibrio bacteriovorus]